MVKHKKEKIAFPTMDMFHELSNEGAVYQWLCATFIKCVVGSNQWARRAHKELLSEIATESDESFVLLTLENNYERWTNEFNLAADDEEGRKRLPEARYTNSGSSKKNGQGSSRRFHGWSREGYLRFNEIHAKVKKDRKSQDNFELELKELLEQQYIDDGKADTLFVDDDDEELVPANDWMGVKQPIGQDKNTKCNNKEYDDGESEDDD